MKVLRIESIGIFVELISSTINIEGTGKSLHLNFVNRELAEFWFDSLTVQIESLDEFTI